MTITEVRNKIRIYRTTYSQELKKKEQNKEYKPKLSWFNDLHKAFHQGKVKSFTKAPSNKSKMTIKPEPSASKLFEFEYQECEEISEDERSDRFEIKQMNKSNDSEHHIIIEPYDEEYDEDYREEPSHIASSTIKPSANANTLNSTNDSTSSPVGTGMLSNELFLKSLQATLDKLPDDKNMRARIKIQEILYKIAYEVEK